MYDIIANEIEKFEQDEAKGLSTTRSNNYLRESHYEEEFTGQEIGFMQARVQEAIEDYLHMNEIESFKVYSDWCVHVIDKDLHEELANGVGHAITEAEKDGTKVTGLSFTLEHTSDTYGEEFTSEQIQEFEKADKEDEKLIHDMHTDIENSHLEEVKDDLNHALEVGDILFEVPEDESTIRLLLDLVKEKQQRNTQEIEEDSYQEGIYQINEDGNTSLVGTIKKG